MIRLFIATVVIVFCFAAVAEDTPSPNPSDLHFKGYADAPQFTVIQRREGLKQYPCMQCHQFMEPNFKVRELSSPHNDIKFVHGEGRVWCLVCHHAEDRNYLRTQLNEKVDYNDAYLVCGGCHANVQRDWYYGGHGKRLGNWQGKRDLYSCPECHNPHKPGIEPRKPQPPPPVRAGQERQHGDGHHRERLWDVLAQEKQEGAHGHH